MMLCLPSFCRKCHLNRKGQLPKRKLASSGTSAYVLFFLVIHSLSPPIPWQAHNIPQRARNIQHFLHLLLHGRLALAPFQPQRVIGHLCDAQIRITGDMGGHGGAVRLDLEQGLGEL